MKSELATAAPQGTLVRRRFRDHIAARPLATFFVLAYGLSWLAWTPFVLSRSGLGLLPFDFPVVLGNTQLTGMLPGAYLGPVTSAIVVTSITEGRPGLRAWRRRLFRFRVSWRWYLGVLVAVPTVLIVTPFLLPSVWGRAHLPAPVLIAAYLPMLAMQIVTTGLAEEPGWRDFALPRLQHRYGPTAGTVVLGMLWGGWHLPLFLTQWGGYPAISWTKPTLFILGCVPLSLVMTWVFNRTGQSVPLVMVLHAGINSTCSLLWPAIFPTLDINAVMPVLLLAAAGAGAVLILALTRGRLGLDGLGQHSGIADPTPSTVIARRS